ncbi:hypothetical protein C2S52_022909 [Perilla frutescens var. hirtella]|nr:hypothetical protein C2S52_022909 [Perilla frutescens var. hirtella]KAH6814930.1 hypothetical protein C2S51_019750 [Perilla frutescens var. frutescens]
MSLSTTQAAARINIAVFYLGFLLIFSQACLPSSAAERSGASHRPRWSPARKARLHHHATARADNLYEEDKRLIHTGPNPLHN